MGKHQKRSFPLTALLIVLIAIVGILVVIRIAKTRAVDPHEGQVLINDGFQDVWITPLEGVAVNTLDEDDFARRDGMLIYTGDEFEAVRGIDVSEHQLEIDWKRVAASGVKFAFIRSGYRGYTQGGLFDDARFETNIKGALDAGLDVGIYFFSQATSVAEAIEEANYAVAQVKDKYNITLPIMFDWEKFEDAEDARTNAIPNSAVGDMGVAFCETVKASGYDAGIYFNRQLGYYGYDLARMQGFSLWVTEPGSFPSFYYAGNIWQYSFTENVPGIEQETDMNFMFIPKETPAPSENNK